MHFFLHLGQNLLLQPGRRRHLFQILKKKFHSLQIFKGFSALPARGEVLPDQVLFFFGKKVLQVGGQILFDIPASHENSPILASSRSFKAIRARNSRDLTVPGGILRIVTISS
ncbi:MAG: hypothetical protein A4E74_02300 [Syntrophus sp. PtaB.Bin075]|nr:MAG: hypothetical protein A4E74_02300 [Syntrophus sp. PtaB.Bin075]